MPSIGARTLVRDITIPESRTIKFKFPPGTSFAELASPVEESPLYAEHKEIMKKHEFKTARKGRVIERRLTYRDGKPYGRRAGD